MNTSRSLSTLKDQLNTGNPLNISTSMYLLIDSVQASEPATQVQAIALLFLLITERYGLDRREVLAIGDAILHDAIRTNNVHITAARMYIEGELK